MEAVNHKRVRVFFFICVALISALTVRLFYIQIICNERFSKASEQQYEVSVEGLDTRGVIFDRNLQPLTDGTRQYYYFLPKKNENELSRTLLEKISAVKISAASELYNVYRTQNFDWDVNEQLKTEAGAYVFRSNARYSDVQPACHLIGYLNDDEKRGVSGIELLCENVLKAENRRLVLWADSCGNILNGAKPAYKNQQEENSMGDNSIVTTIDKNLQSFCEKIFEERQLTGACLVSRADTGEIYAWLSSPVFNPNNVEAYLDAENDCLVNKVVQGAYAPGSIFKIVVAAAALENNVCDEELKLVCEGQADVSNLRIKCSTAPPSGHGKISMCEAMAKSCNSYFVQLGELTGCDNIITAAKNFGLGETVFCDFPEENCGNIPKPDFLTEADTANISIGQGTILVTPAQIQKLISIIANGGVDAGLTIFKKSDAVMSGPSEESETLVSSGNVEVLENLLAEVMKSGTGSNVKWDVPVWGKSGTAEATSHGTDVKNCWFTGYCQIGDERYVITVLVEKGVSGSASALPVFSQIVSYLAKHL